MSSNEERSGILEIWKGDGRLRDLDGTLISSPRDPIVPSHLIERYDLRPGMRLEAKLGKTFGGNGGKKKGKRGKKGRSQQPQRTRNRNKLNAIDPAAHWVEKVISVEGEDPDQRKEVRRFEDLTSIDPQPRMTLEYPGCPAACRLMDLFCPLGFGQRALIVSPPKAGKTMLLQAIANAIAKNHPDVKLFTLLIDERPEEVTDFRRNVPGHVLASSNDHTPDRHVCLSVVAIERAKRLAEEGHDVIVLLDSLTRLGRAFNTMPGLPQVGRTLSGGLDAGALAIPKQLFGAARKFEEGGSLSIIATALIETGSRGDQVIFEEFKGTGNMEMILDRKIAERRLFPAINLAASGTRKEHLLLSDNELKTMAALRRRLLNMQPFVQVEQLLKALERFKTNADLVGQSQPQSA